MRAAWSQCLFDLRRLAPWVAVHTAFWFWRALTFELDDFGHSGWPVYAQEMAAILLLGALVSESPLFGRRAFWRTRAIDPITLLGGRLLFLTIVLWLPRILANHQILSFLGEAPLRPLVMLDVMTYQALWLLSLLALISLVRRPIEVVAVPVVITFGLAAADWILRSTLDWLLFHDPTDLGRATHQLMHATVSAGLSVAILLGLVALYRRQRSGLVAAILCAVLAVLSAISFGLSIAVLLGLVVLHRRNWLTWSVGASWAVLAIVVPAALVPTLSAWWWPHPQIDPPAALELDLQTDLAFPMHYDGPATVLRTRLVPQEFPSDLGFSVLSAQGELTTSDGEVLSIQGRTDDSCRYPAALLKRIPTLSFHAFQTMLNCGPDASLPLSLRGRRVKDGHPLQGTLDLNLRLKTFRAEAQLVDTTHGTTVHHGLETFVLHQVDPPLGGLRTMPRFHLSHFFLGNTRHPYAGHRLSFDDEHSLTGRHSHLRLLDSANYEMMHSGVSGNTSPLHFNFGPFSRLRMRRMQKVPKHRPLREGEVLGPPHFQLLDLHLTYSPEIDATLRIEDFRFGVAGN